MNIEDCKIGTRVVCLGDRDSVIPKGSLGTLIEAGCAYPYVSWDGCYQKHLVESKWGYENVYAVIIDDLEVVKEEEPLSKLTVNISNEAKIVKDILKIVLQDLNVIISEAIDNLSDGTQTLFEGDSDLPDEEIHNLMNEVIKDIMKDCVELGIIEASSPQTELTVVTEDSVLTNLLNLIDKAAANSDLESLLNLTTAYQRMKNASTI